MAIEEQDGDEVLHDKLVTYHAFVIALRYVILAHVAAAAIAISWLSGLAIGWGVIIAYALLALGIYVIGPFKTDERHPPLDDPPYHKPRP
jgi:hypothetical protein